jgi:tRNA modification GTPase
VVNDRLAGTSELGFSGSEPTFDLSAKSGEGFDALLEQLTKHAETYLVGAESALVTRERHRRALEDVVAALRRASRGDPDREDLLAEELRIAAQSLGRLTGRVDVEDVLDVIFRDFCIGK